MYRLPERVHLLESLFTRSILFAFSKCCTIYLRVSETFEGIYALELSGFFLRVFPAAIQYTVHRFVSHVPVSFSFLPSILSGICHSFIMENLPGHLNNKHWLMFYVYLNAYTTRLPVKASPTLSMNTFQLSSR
jgi:hypothetical protein